MEQRGGSHYPNDSIFLKAWDEAKSWQRGALYGGSSPVRMFAVSSLIKLYIVRFCHDTQ